MKRRLIICLLLCLTGLLVVAGCSKKNDAQSSPATGTSNQANSSTSSGQNANSGQSNQRQKPDIFGQVKSVSGSDITIALAQMPQRNQNQSGQNQQNQSSNQPSGNNKGQGQKGNWTLQLTGESKTVTIPEGTKIYGGGGPGPGAQNQGQSQGPKEITLNDIKAGDTISVYYTTGTTTVDHVSVRLGGQQSS